MTYFLKELLNNKLRLENGVPVTFEDVGGNMGILATEDQSLITQLKTAELRSVGGVYEIEKDKYDNLKKKVGTASLSRRNLLSAVKLVPLVQAPQGASAESAAAVEVGQPLEVPEAIPPTTKKVNRPKSKTKKVSNKSDNLLENIS